MHALFMISVVFCITALSSASTTKNVDETNDNAPSPSQAYVNAHKYVQKVDSELQTMYFPDVVDDAEKDDDVNTFKRVEHLIIGRGVAGTNLFASRYANVVEYADGKSPYTCNGSYSIQKDVLIVGNEVTGLWNNATTTLAQPLSALTFPYLPYNPVDFVGEKNMARVERDEFVSCVDMHRALLTSQCAIGAPVLTALVENVTLAESDGDCAKDGGMFMVTLENTKHSNDSKTNAKQALLCVGEIDIATGRGIPRSAFKKSDGGYHYDITEEEYKRITSSNSSGFGFAPALIDDFRKFILTPDEDVSEVATPNEDGKRPRIIIDGGGGTVLPAIRRAMLTKDDISENIVYTDPDSTFHDTKNPQMIRRVLRKPDTQNAIVNWTSRGDLSDIALRGENEVRGGSAYSIVDLFNNSASKSIYGGFGSTNYFKNLCCIDFKIHPMIATFCPYPPVDKDKKCACCEEANNATNATASRIEFDQFVTCIGEDDTKEQKELYNDQRFGDSIVINATLNENVQPSSQFAYAVGFENTHRDVYHTLRIFGAAATNRDLEGNHIGETFDSATQMHMNGGQVVPLQFAGNMLAMMSQLQIYTTTVLQKRIAKINLSMSTSDFILRFLDEACVSLDSSTKFVKYLQNANNYIQPKNDVEWPLNPNGIGEDDLKKMIQQYDDLSKNIYVSRGRTLVSKHDQPCAGGGDGEDNGDGVALPNKYFAAYVTGSCFRDCAPGPFGCAIVPPWVALYDSIEICCSLGLSWVNFDYCTFRSVGTYTDGWVVDWQSETCVKDCDPINGSPCKAHTDFSLTIFDTPDVCCGALLGWIDPGTCVADSNVSN